MPKRLYLIFLTLIFLAGCSTMPMTTYLQDKHPYKREFYATFDETVQAAKKILDQQNWEITQIGDPKIYEEASQDIDDKAKSILIFAEPKKRARVYVSRKSLLNIYVRAMQNATEVEIRYAVNKSIIFKKSRSYRNDRYIKRFFDLLRKELEK